MESFTDITKRFPHESSRMGYVVGFQENTLVYIMSEGAFNDVEIEAIRTGEIRYGIFIRDYIPFMLFDFSFGKFEFPINVFSVFPDRDKLLEEYKGQISFMVYDNNMPGLFVGRSINISLEVVRHLKSSLTGQLKKHRIEQSVNMRIIEIEDKYSDAKMTQMSSMLHYSID
jgi:hypothetical protein